MNRSWLFPVLLAAATLVFVAAIVAVTRQNVQQMQTLYDANALVLRTLDVQRQLDTVLLATTDAESGERGFLLTGDESYLEPYISARERLNAALQRLTDLVDTSAPRHAEVLELRTAVETKFTELAQRIEVRRTLGLAPALMMTTSNAGLRTMEEIRTITGQMANEQAALLASRQAQADVALSSAISGRIGSGFLSGGLLMALAFLAFIQGRMRERIARQIADEREHLAVTVASIGDAVIATDTGKRITLMNQVATALTGWTETDAIGRPIGDVFRIVNESTRQTAENPIDRALKEGASQRLANHTLLVGRDGTEWPIDDSASPIRGADGKVRGAVLVFRDVSERRARDAALRESEQRYREAAGREQAARAEAEHANRLKDEFLAMLSHELRTPLNAVLGWTQILQAGAAQEKTVTRALASIRRNAEAQQRLVEDLLDVSRIVTGKFVLDRKPVELRVSVGAAADAIRLEALAKGVDLHVDLDGPLVVNADPYRIQQVAANLLSNALKFTPSGGQIQVMLAAAGDRGALVVSDTGQGIPAGLQPYIFDRFRQGDGSRTRAHGGLGLGLAIVKHIVDAHEGTIEVRSEGDGRGTTFRVLLPLTPARVEAQAEAPRSALGVSGSLQLTGIRVLLVDNDADSLELVSYALTHAGAAVTIARSGREALALLKRQSPDVVLTDLQMPEFDGFDLLEEMGRGTESAVPAIAMTARAKVGDRARAIGAGFSGYIAKPIDLSGLVATIRSVVGGRP